jgi:hypothetical protein
MINIQSTAIATIIAVITSTVVTLLINRANRKQILDQQLNDILKLALQYPYLESKLFTDNWCSKYDLSDEKSLRYEIYATLVFNYLSDFTKFFRYNINKIEKTFQLKIG